MRTLTPWLLLLALATVGCPGDSKTAEKTVAEEDKTGPAPRRPAGQRAKIARAETQIKVLKVQLFSYKTDNGMFPRLAPRPATAGDTDKAYQDDAPALYGGLQNEPTLQTGGGQNSPYLQDWKTGYGLMDRDYLEPGMMGQDGRLGTGAKPIPDSSSDEMKTLAYQKVHSPVSKRPIVFLDPWGNPYHYREWATVRMSVKKELLSGPKAKRAVARGKKNRLSVSDGETGAVEDQPHEIESFDIWSNGPNGINEFGHPDSDDITSWSDE